MANSNLLKQMTAPLITALADKGTPGLILLALVLIAIWIVPTVLIFKLTALLDLAVAKSHPVPFFVGLAGVVTAVTFLAYFMTRAAVVQSIAPVLRAEAEAGQLMPHAFGGTVVTLSGDLTVEQLPAVIAKRRIRRILETLVYHASTVLDVTDREMVRGNIIVADDSQWMHISQDYHVNMKNKKELGIEIPVGYYSSGTAYKYFHPVLSVKKKQPNGPDIWPYDPDDNHIDSEKIDRSRIEKVLKSIDVDLRWIISMPIPIQVRPYNLVCGVLNIDGLSPDIFRDQLKILLRDAANAAALIGIINRTSGVLEGQCYRPPNERPKKLPGVKESQLPEFLIEPTEFDPADCPEPTEEFKNQLSKVVGLEFLRDISTTQVAHFLREQLQ